MVTTMSNDDSNDKPGDGMISTNEAPRRRVRVRPDQIKKVQLTELQKSRLYEGVGGGINAMPLPGDPLPDEEDLGIPKWVEEAERQYIGKKLGTVKAVATHHKQEVSTVTTWSVKRKWTERRRRAEDEAARLLADKIDEEAAQGLADAFAGMDQDVIVAGQMYARLYRMVAQDQMKKGQLNQNNGAPIVIQAPSKDVVAAIRMAQELRPKRSTERSSDDFGSALNPEEGETSVLAPVIDDLHGPDLEFSDEDDEGPDDLDE